MVELLGLVVLSRVGFVSEESKDIDKYKVDGFLGAGPWSRGAV